MSSILDRYVGLMSTFNQWVTQSMGGGPKHLKLAWVVNMQKGGTFPFVLALMAYYQNWSTAAWVYLALHGSYGLCWLIKDTVFPDPSWQVRITYSGALAAFLLVLGPYWLIPWVMISGMAEGATSGIALALPIIMHTIGLCLMIGADAQKHFTLKYKKGLITSGFFSRSRNPNYLGEMMIYGSYALLVGHWLPWLILGWVWVALFLPNILRKERSMSRYPEWANYVNNSGLLLPKI